jgi:hypothetical protein
MTELSDFTQEILDFENKISTPPKTVITNSQINNNLSVHELNCSFHCSPNDLIFNYEDGKSILIL